MTRSQVLPKHKDYYYASVYLPHGIVSACMFINNHLVNDYNIILHIM